MTKVSRNLRERVTESAEAVLVRNGAVGPLELLEQIGFLSYAHVRDWKKGNPYYDSIEPHIQCGNEKLEKTYKIFFEWVNQKQLEPFEVTYKSVSRTGAQPLKIATDGNPETEIFFRTHFRPANLTSAKKKRIEKKLNKTPDLAVYQLSGKSSACSECSAELHKGEFVFLEKQEALCLTCADMDHLEFLPSGDAAMTRRSKKLSPLSAIVLRFSRSRKRYERQGILVTTAAIDAAEQQCAADADSRAQRRERDAERRAGDDQVLIEEMTKLIQTDYPGCPDDEALAIAIHTAQRGSGRVGRSAAGRNLQTEAITLAVAAWVRHQHTNYDELLMQGTDRREARRMIRADQEQAIARWAAGESVSDASKK